MDRLISQTAGAFGTAVLFEAADPCAFLMERYPRWPRNARLFHEGRSVTPTDSGAIAHLETLSGRFLLAIPAQDPITLGISLALSFGIGFLLRPEMPEAPTPKKARRPSGSPTNALQDIGNTVRLGERIPDIYGTVRVTPDLLSPSLTLFENGIEVTYDLLCVGRGFNDVFLATVMDGTHSIVNVPGYSCQFYKPAGTVVGGDVHLDTDTPYGVVGKSFTPPNMFVQRIEGAEYEQVPPYNDSSMSSSSYHDDSWDPAYYESGLFPRKLSYVDDLHGHIESRYHGTNDPNDENSNAFFNYDLSAKYPVGSRLRILETEYVSVWGDGSSYDADGIKGVYRVIKAEREQIWLDIPAAKVTSWEAFPSGNLDSTGGLVTHIISLRDDPPELVYDIDRAKKGIWVNLVAPEGLYYHDGRGYVSTKWTIEHVWTRLDGQGVSGSYFEDFELRGGSRTTLGKSVWLDNPWVSGYECSVEVQIRRLDPRVPGTLAYRTNGQSGSAPVEENGGVYWTVESKARVDLHSIFSVLEETSTSLGENITVALTRVENSFATRGLRQRKLTVNAQRLLWVPGFSLRSYSARLDFVLYDMCRDSVIGRQSLDATDVSSWGTVASQIHSHFGADYAMSEFHHVFDDMDVSFEDMVTQVAQNCFCRAYRIGEVLQLSFEEPEDGAYGKMIFNSRNILPDTLKTGVRFGIENGHDSVQVSWKDPDQLYTVREYTVPAASEVLTPKDYDVIGIAYERKALVHSWRHWQRMRLSDTQIEFDATGEAALLLPGDVIIVADLTDPANVIDCDIIDVEDRGGGVSRIHFSRSLTIPDNTTMWFQYRLGSNYLTTVQYTVNGGGGQYSYVETTQTWPLEFNTDKESFYRTCVVGYPNTGEADYTAFEHFYRVLEIKPSDKGTYVVSAEKYHPAIYTHDSDTV